MRTSMSWSCTSRALQTFSRNFIPLTKPFRQNNDCKFPSRTLEASSPVEVDGEEKYFIDRIVNHKKVDCISKYLVRWTDEHAGADIYHHLLLYGRWKSSL